MNGTEASVGVAWGLVALLGLGLASAWFARLSERSRCPTPFRHAFIGFLALVGAMTFVSALLGSQWWLICGATFWLMVLVVTCDFSRPRKVPAW